MGLTFRYEFRAPAAASPSQLAGFLHRVEIEAQTLGFRPTAVVNVPFDTDERVEFARRLASGYWVEDSRLKSGVPVGVSSHIGAEGTCCLPPTRGVVLVVTNEQDQEACFGFMQYPETVRSTDGTTLAETGLAGGWAFQDFIQTPDPRYRVVVQMFADAGYLKNATDDFAAKRVR
jgi:hypothetical protein